MSKNRNPVHGALWSEFRGQVRAAVRKPGRADECDGRCDAVDDHHDDAAGPGGPADAAGGRRGRHRAQPELARRPVQLHRRRHCLARPGRALTAAGQTKRNMNCQFDYTVIDSFFECEYYTVVIAYIKDNDSIFLYKLEFCIILENLLNDGGCHFFMRLNFNQTNQNFFFFFTINN